MGLMASLPAPSTGVAPQDGSPARRDQYTFPMPEQSLPSNAEAPAVEIVAAGDELLNGDVLDTNSHELCVLVTGLGGRVSRTTTVRDDVETIAHEIRAALARRPDLAVHRRRPGPDERRPHPRGRRPRRRPTSPPAP